MKNLNLFSLITLVVTLTSHFAMGQEIKNSDFAQWNNDRPVNWTVRKNKQKLSKAVDIEHDSAKTALQVELISDGGKSFGEILQKIKFESYTRYRISGDIRSSVNGIGIFQVKTIRSKKELERISSKRSTIKWQTMSIEFDTTNADEVQILCRYNQKAQNLGGKIWWTNLKIEKLGEGAPPEDPNKLNIASPGSNQYITPNGLGNRDGSSWENARAATHGFQDALNAVGPGNTLYIGSGTYEKIRLKLSAGGSGPDKMVTIHGKDTGDGLPKFTSNFDKKKPSKTGDTLFIFEPYVGFVSIQNLRLEDYKAGIVMNGPNRGIRITDVDVTRAREGIIVNGAAIPHQLDSGTNDLIIQDCDFGPYTKRAIRLRGGVNNVQITNCHADAGGEPWATERFAMGFTVEGSRTEGIKDHNITYLRCTSRNHYDPNGKKYWNADGFTNERRTGNITYIDCGAFDNTDGGWDVKGENIKFINCVSLRNKRNYRVWSKAQTPAVFYNCVAAFSKLRGGTGNRNGLHLTPGAGAKLSYCTFIDNGQAIDVDADHKLTEVTLEDCLIYEPHGQAQAGNSNQAKITFKNSIIIDQAQSSADPDFVNITPDWEGGDNKFNSQTYTSQGYQHQRKIP